MKSRRNNAVKPRVVAWIVVLAAGICLILLGYLREKNRVHEFGREIKKLENDLEAARKHHDGLRRRYAGMCSPAELDQRVRQMNLGLGAPQPEQIIRMYEPGVNPAEKRYAGNQSP